ncbi:hypothetical protein BANRA_05053 [Klebsiella pneumoniae]|nr:hypothetical protein BANRA_05053 [Klebsiella pneumoniae]
MVRTDVRHHRISGGIRRHVCLTAHCHIADASVSTSAELSPRKRDSVSPPRSAPRAEVVVIAVAVVAIAASHPLSNPVVDAEVTGGALSCVLYLPSSSSSGSDPNAELLSPTLCRYADHGSGCNLPKASHQAEYLTSGRRPYRWPAGYCRCHRCFAHCGYRNS